MDGEVYMSKLLSVASLAFSSKTSCMLFPSEVLFWFRIVSILVTAKQELNLWTLLPDTLLSDFPPVQTCLFMPLNLYFKSSTFLIWTPCDLTVPPGFSSFTHTHTLRLTSLPLLSRAYLHPTRFSPMCFLLSLQITMSSANVALHKVQSKLVCQLLITTLKKKVGRVDPWASKAF